MAEPIKPFCPGESRAAAMVSWRVAIGGLATFAGTRLIAIVLESSSMPSAVGQAVLAQWGSGRLGVAWSHPKAPVQTMSAIARRAGLGAAIGVVAAGLVVAFLASTQAIVLERVAPQASAIVVAFVTAGLYAMRDELLLHGLVLRALVTAPSPLLRVVSCGVTSAAMAYGEVGSSAPRAVVVQGLLGVIFGALWVRDRGAFPAWGAHTAWLFTSSLLMQGGVFESRVASTAWGGGDAGPLGGTAAMVALLPLAFGAIGGTVSSRWRNPQTG